MSSEEEADNNLQKFFLPIEWSEMSDLEKSRAQNIFDNYQTMKSMGLQPQEPYFIKDYKKREEENVARIARLKATSSKKVYRVNEGASTSGSCRSTITKPLATNSDVSASLSSQSRKETGPSINADPPRSLSVRLDIEKYFSDKEWARKTQLERDQLRAELEMYSLNRTFGKNPEPPSFVLAYKEQKVRHLQKIREEKLSNVGKGLKFKKASKPSNNAEDNNQQISTSIIENNSQNIQAKKSVKPVKSSNDIKQRKSKEEAQVHGPMTVSQIDDVLKIIRDSTVEPSLIKKLKTNGEIIKIFQYESFEGSVLRKKFNPKTLGRPIQINGAKSPKVVQILLKRIETNKKSGLSKRLQNKSNSDMPIIEVNEDGSFSETRAELEISNNEPKTSKNDPASQRELDNISYTETSRKNLEVSSDSSVFKIPLVPKKPTSSTSRQVKVAEKDKLMQLAANGALTGNNYKLRKKLIRKQSAKLGEERRKEYEEEIARRTSREYIWNDFFNEVSSLTFEETDDLCFTAVEQKLSLTIYHSWKNEVLAPMASDLLDEEKSKIEAEDEKKKKRKECGEKKKKKSNVKTSGNALSADATGSDVSGSAVSGSTCQEQKNDESVGKKR
ncbi:uncharacterized protein LOC111058794, partial [Nilaparvata lugens]|uniref:uncharacterized protein LOC111058794 n=1 Tax=Nilaparvata lugens TaxID=108931 RepID=UPI00193C9E3D